VPGELLLPHGLLHPDPELKAPLLRHCAGGGAHRRPRQCPPGRRARCAAARPAPAEAGAPADPRGALRRSSVRRKGRAAQVRKSNRWPRGGTRGCIIATPGDPAVWQPRRAPTIVSALWSGSSFSGSRASAMAAMSRSTTGRGHPSGAVSRPAASAVSAAFTAARTKRLSSEATLITPSHASISTPRLTTAASARPDAQSRSGADPASLRLPRSARSFSTCSMAARAMDSGESLEGGGPDDLERSSVAVGETHSARCSVARRCRTKKRRVAATVSSSTGMCPSQPRNIEANAAAAPAIWAPTAVGSSSSSGRWPTARPPVTRPLGCPSL